MSWFVGLGAAGLQEKAASLPVCQKSWTGTKEDGKSLPYLALASASP
jgi:hypothetical protein